MNDDRRYAEGNREEHTCRQCGSPCWIVYHGPRANHTVESRPDGRVEQLEGRLQEAEKALGELRVFADPLAARLSDAAYRGNVEPRGWEQAAERCAFLIAALNRVESALAHLRTEEGRDE